MTPQTTKSPESPESPESISGVFRTGPSVRIRNTDGLRTPVRSLPDFPDHPVLMAAIQTFAARSVRVVTNPFEDDGPFPTHYHGRRLVGWTRSGDPLYALQDEHGHPLEARAVVIPRTHFLRPKKTGGTQHTTQQAKKGTK